MAETLSLEFWYQEIPIGEIWKNWVTNKSNISDLLGFEKTKKIPAPHWDYVTLKGKKVFVDITERIENHTAVNIYSRSLEPPDFESLLKGVYDLTQYPLPTESCLVNGDDECSGPLLTLSVCRKKPKECLEGIQSNVRETDKKLFTPQIRVISSSVYPNLGELLELSKKYSLNQKIIKDNLWIDFYWSKFSKTWEI